MTSSWSSLTTTNMTKTEQQKSDIGYKNMNPKLSMKSNKTGYRPQGAGSNTTESKKTSGSQPASLSKKVGASALPLHGQNRSGFESKVSRSNTTGLKNLARTQRAGAASDPASTKPTWNTRKGAKKARRYK